jgi:hypothetical protein
VGFIVGFDTFLTDPIVIFSREALSDDSHLIIPFVLPQTSIIGNNLIQGIHLLVPKVLVKLMKCLMDPISQKCLDSGCRRNPIDVAIFITLGAISKCLQF